GLDERAHEPGPDRPLVVRAVALARAARVARRVAGLTGGERAEAERGHEPRLDRVDDAARPRPLEHRERQAADGQDLVRPERRVDRPGPVVDVDDVGEMAARLVPEARHEGAPRPLVEIGPALGEAAPDAERVQPERLDLDRLADARRDHPVTHLGVHPGELDAGLARGEEAVVIEVDAVAGPGRVAREDRLHRADERLPLARRDMPRALQELVHGPPVPERGGARVELGRPAPAAPPQRARWRGPPRARALPRRRPGPPRPC